MQKGMLRKVKIISGTVRIIGCSLVRLTGLFSFFIRVLRFFRPIRLQAQHLSDLGQKDSDHINIDLLIFRYEITDSLVYSLKDQQDDDHDGSQRNKYADQQLFRDFIVGIPQYDRSGEKLGPGLTKAGHFCRQQAAAILF